MSAAADQCTFVSAAGVRCHRVAGHDGGHKPYPLDWDLPADLAAVLRDLSVVVPQDQQVWETIARGAVLPCPECGLPLELGHDCLAGDPE